MGVPPAPQPRVQLTEPRTTPPVHRMPSEEPLNTILIIVLIMLLLAALPTFPYSMNHNSRRLAPTTRSRVVTPPEHDPFVTPPEHDPFVTPPEHDPFVETQIVTLRVHRTWSDRLKLWRHAYQTKISDSRGEVIGRGYSAEASREADKKQWDQEHRTS